MRRHKRLHTPGLNGRRRTVLYPMPNDERVGDELYPYMLIEDIGHRVMPLGRRWTERDFAVELVPPSERFEALITDALEPEGYEGLSDAVCDFFRTSAQVAMRYGRAIYEVVYLTDDSREVVALDFAYVPPCSISRKGGEFIQRVPEQVAAQWQAAAEIHVPSSDIIILDPPLEAKRLARMLKALADISRLDLPKFVEEELRGEARIGYSATENSRFRELAIAEVSREIGWDARSALTGKETFLEYYTIMRRLRFERFLARFRARLVDQLNLHLRVLGERLGESGQLRLAGMPTEADVHAAELSLGRGDRDFGELLAPFSR